MERKIECSTNAVKLGKKIYPCTLSVAMDLVGGKWKAVILYHLKNGEKRFNELRKDLYSVTETTLSIQLKQLENDGLISKTIIGKKPPLIAIYRLTDFGKTFLPILDSITEWGNKIIQEKGEFVPDFSYTED